MAGAALRIDWPGRLVERWARDRERRLRILRPLLGEIGQRVTQLTRARFRAGVGPDGRAWKPSLRVVHGGGQTLRQTGRLRGSIVPRVRGNVVEVGTNVRYAGVHQFGRTIRARRARALTFPIPGGGFARVKSVRIPARPYLGLSDRDERVVLDIVRRWMARARDV